LLVGSKIWGDGVIQEPMDGEEEQYGAGGLLRLGWGEHGTAGGKRIFTQDTATKKKREASKDEKVDSTMIRREKEIRRLSRTDGEKAGLLGKKANAQYNMRDQRGRNVWKKRRGGKKRPGPVAQGVSKKEWEGKKRRA